MVEVSGELGTGKTTFVRGAARALGVQEPIVSPTFTIGRRYAGEPSVSHLDLYRLAGLEREDPGLLADYLTPESVTFVEWPEQAGDVRALQTVTWRVSLAHLGGDRRRVRTERLGSR